MEVLGNGDETDLICRVCRSDGTPERPLFHPCICTGSIKYVHQDCLVQWLKYSKKEYCELCKHKFSFTPIYAPDMPAWLPVRDICSGLIMALWRAIRFWCHYTLVAFAWLILVPLIAFRIYQTFFIKSFGSILTLPLDILSLENIPSDAFQGCFIVAVTLAAFIFLIWLREQILIHDTPDWMRNIEEPMPNIEFPPRRHDAVPEIHNHRNLDLPENRNHFNEHGVPVEREQRIRYSALDEPFTNRNVPDDDDDVNNNDNENQSDDAHSFDERYIPGPSGLGNQNIGKKLDSGKNHVDNEKKIASKTARLVDKKFLDFESVAIDNLKSDANSNKSGVSKFHNLKEDDDNEASFSEKDVSKRQVIFSSKELLNQDNILNSSGENDDIENEDLFANLRYVDELDVMDADVNISKIDNRNISSDLENEPTEGKILENDVGDEIENDMEDVEEDERRIDHDNHDHNHPDIDEEEGDEPGGIGGLFAAALGGEPRVDVANGDAPMEDLTWEQVLGLDGSLAFLEHVFWVVTLNALFLLIFGWMPFHSGRLVLYCFNFNIPSQITRPSSSENDNKSMSLQQLFGVIALFIGYAMVALSMIGIFFIGKFFRWRKTCDGAAVCYLIIKVVLLLFIEVLIFPTTCGAWLDICSLSILGTTLLERKDGFESSLGSSVFLHWLVGMVFVFYFASLMLMVRESLRPGTLWFLRNLNDPDFNPVHEMIHFALFKHLRRFILSLTVFGLTIFLMVYIPTHIIKAIFPSFLPYRLSFKGETPLSELTLEFLILQACIPSLLQQSHAKAWIKSFILKWASLVSWFLGLRSYLLGDVDLTHYPREKIIGEDGRPLATVDQTNKDEYGNSPPQNVPPLREIPRPFDEPVPNVDLALGAVHEAMLNGRPGEAYHPYYKPNHFSLRIFALLLILAAWLVCVSLVLLMLPVALGRFVLSFFWDVTLIHELYTIVFGIQLIWLTARSLSFSYGLVNIGIHDIVKTIVHWIEVGLKFSLVAFVVFGLIPFLFGLLFELVLVIPFRVPMNQTPLFFPIQDWILGLLHVKMICGITMLGPRWWFKDKLSRVFEAGLQNIDVWFILDDLCFPIAAALILFLAVPYVYCYSLLPLAGFSDILCQHMFRRVYPFVTGVIFLTTFFHFQVQQIYRLCLHLRNEKYLVGKKLVNYHSSKKHMTLASPVTDASTSQPQ